MPRVYFPSSQARSLRSSAAKPDKGFRHLRPALRYHVSPEVGLDKATADRHYSLVIVSDICKSINGQVFVSRFPQALFHRCLQIRSGPVNALFVPSASFQREDGRSRQWCG